MEVNVYLRESEIEILIIALNRYILSTKADEHTAGPEDWRRYFNDLEKLRVKLDAAKKRVDDAT
jgi:hypothetical protein